MRIISWNVAGIKARQAEIERLVPEWQPDILCCQKTRTKEAPVLEGYYKTVYCTDRWSGVATYVRHELAGNIIESDTHHIVTEFDSFILINAYVPYSSPKVPGYIERRKEWDVWIVKFVKSQTKPVVICGDLNIAHTDLDTFYPSCVRNTGCYYSWEREDFNRLLSDGKMVDTFRRLHPNHRTYTYFDTMHGADYRAINKGTRLDYFLISRMLIPLLEDSVVLSDFGTAPSVPIMLSLSTT